MPGHRVEQLFAFVTIEGDDDEGLFGVRAPSGDWLPLVAADVARLEYFRPFAKAAAKVAGKRIRLVRFDRMTDLEIIEP